MFWADGKGKQIPFRNDRKKSKGKQIPFENDRKKIKGKQIPFGNDRKKSKVSEEFGFNLPLKPEEDLNGIPSAGEGWRNAGHYD